MPSASESGAGTPPGGHATGADNPGIISSEADGTSLFFLYAYDIDHSQGAESQKSKFISLFPNKYTNEQLEKIGPDGHALPGAQINPGDPILLGYEPRSLSAKESALGNLHKVLKGSFRDLSQTWKKPTPGVIADAVKLVILLRNRKGRSGSSLR